MNRCWNPTGRIMLFEDQTLYQIYWDSDRLVHPGVRRGTLGGWVEGADSLRDEAWVGADAVVMSGSCVYEQALVTDKVMLERGTEVFGSAIVAGKAYLRNVRVFGHAQVLSEARVVSGNSSPIEISGRARVTGCAYIHGNATVRGAAEISDYAVVCGSAQVHGNAQVYGRASIGGCAQVFGDASVYEYAEICGNTMVYDRARIRGHCRLCGCGQKTVWATNPCDEVELYSAHFSEDADCAQEECMVRVCGDAVVAGRVAITGERTIADREVIE